MFLKILVTVILAVVAWMLVTRLTGGGRPRRPVRDKRPNKPASDLVKCKACGIYLPADQPCDCSGRA